MTAKACACVRRHVPRVVVHHVHHVVPQSWGGTATAPSSMGPGRNTVTVCPTTHAAVHLLLNIYVRTDGAPTRAQLRPYNRYTRDLARRGWDSRLPERPTPYTTDHGAAR